MRFTRDELVKLLEGHNEAMKLVAEAKIDPGKEAYELGALLEQCLEQMRELEDLRRDDFNGPLPTA